MSISRRCSRIAPGELWVGCAYSVDRYDPVTEKFVHYRLDQPPAAHTSGAVRHISQDREGRLWLSTGNGLYRLDPETRLRAALRARELQSFQPEQQRDQVQRRGSVRRFLGRNTARDSISSIRQNGRVTLHVPLHEPGDLKFYEDREGTFWILQTNQAMASRFWIAALIACVRYSFAHRDSPGTAH